VYYRGPTTGKFPRTVPLAKSAVLTYVDPDGISRTVKFAKINVTLVNGPPGTPGPVEQAREASRPKLTGTILLLGS
jgi:hypothetical protein